MSPNRHCACGRLTIGRVCRACAYIAHYPYDDREIDDTYALPPGEWRLDPVRRVQTYIPYSIGA